MQSHVHAKFQQFYPFGFQQSALQRGIRFANQQFATRAHHAVPRNAFPRRRSRHCPACGSRAARQMQSFRQRSIGNNPSARDLFHELINATPGHLGTFLAETGSIVRRVPRQAQAESNGVAQWMRAKRKDK